MTQLGHILSMLDQSGVTGEGFHSYNEWISLDQNYIVRPMMLIVRTIKDDPDQGGGKFASEHVQEIHSICGDIFPSKEIPSMCMLYWYNQDLFVKIMENTWTERSTII